MRDVQGVIRWMLSVDILCLIANLIKKIKPILRVTSIIWWSDIIHRLLGVGDITDALNLKPGAIPYVTSTLILLAISNNEVVVP